MNKAAFTDWFSKEFPLFSVKIVERRVLGTNLTQVWFSTIDNWKNCACNIDLNAPNLMVFDFWNDRAEVEVGSHSQHYKYKEKGAAFRKQKAKSESEFIAKVQAWLLKNKAVIQSMA